MTSYKALEDMEYKKAIVGKEFSINNPIADSIKNQVQILYGKVTDYVDNILKIDSIKSSYNKTMNTIDNVVDKYIIDNYTKKKELQPVYLK